MNHPWHGLPLIILIVNVVHKNKITIFVICYSFYISNQIDMNIETINKMYFKNTYYYYNSRAGIFGQTCGDKDPNLFGNG